VACTFRRLGYGRPVSAAITIFPDHPEPVASIVVLGWRAAPMLLRCLESLAAGVSDIPYEVLIVLNEPTDDLRADVEANDTGARVWPAACGGDDAGDAAGPRRGARRAGR
jgi:hypothetical protein